MCIFIPKFAISYSREENNQREIPVYSGTFLRENSERDPSNYFDGLSPDCPATETIPGDWGDETEALLAEGIYYLQNDRCRTGGAGVNSVLKPTQKVDFSQGPVKVRNAR